MPRKVITRKQRFRSPNGRPPKADPPREYATLGAPPEDALAATEYVHEALSVSFYHVMTDDELTEKERRKEMREIAKTMRDLVPQTRLRKAEDVIRDQQARLDDELGAELEDAVDVEDEDVARPRRGRPRKR